MKDMIENQDQAYFERFMEQKGFKNRAALVEYVMYLESVKSDHEVLKDMIANLHKNAQEMY